ncbi:hypothetical protein CR513_31509, partial [Mucuna pruriens]
MQFAGFGSIRSQTILNPQGGGVGTVRLRSRREFPQLDKPQLSLRPVEAKTESRVDSRVQQPARSVQPPFPNQIVLARRFEIDEDLLKLFRKVENNIPLIDAIKQVPKYAKFLKELYVHKRKKIKEAVEIGGIVSALVKHEGASASLQQILPKKCQDPGIFAVPCTINNHMFVDAMLDLGALINCRPGWRSNLPTEVLYNPSTFSKTFSSKSMS